MTPYEISWVAADIVLPTFEPVPAQAGAPVDGHQVPRIDDYDYDDGYGNEYRDSADDGVPEGGVGVSTWDDARETLDAFAVEVLSGQGLPGDGSGFVQVSLVHRADNDYNRRAMSVAAPRRFGGSVQERHLGYLKDHYLARVGVRRLPDLAAFTDGELLCTATLAGGLWLSLHLPDGPDLGRAIDEFFDRHADTPAGRRRHHRLSGPTEAALEQISTFATPQPEPVGGLEVSVFRNGRGRPRSLHLRDPTAGRYLGEIALGHLFLQDERDRSTVLELLTVQGVPVAQPRSPLPWTPPPPPPGLADREPDPGGVPNLCVYWFPEGLDLRPPSPDGAPGWASLAHFNPTTRRLWVEDATLAPAALRYAARVGLDVADVGLPSSPWGLGEDVPWRELRDLDLRSDSRHETVPRVYLLRAVRDLLPRGVLTAEDVTWIDGPLPPIGDETEEVSARNERFVTARKTLFPNHSVVDHCAGGQGAGGDGASGRLAGCRLCGQPGLTFTTAVCTTSLTYCHACLHNAATGAVRNRTDRERAGRAVRALAELEFDGLPMLESQLDAVHVDTARPVDAGTVDRALLLRFALSRGAHPWTLLLVDAGLAAGGIRGSRGTVIPARDGHLCHSLQEKAVCDFLHLHGVSHEREPLYPVDAELNPRGRRRADWLLTDGTLVEMWGMPNDPAYAAKMAEKTRLAARHGLTVVGLTDADLPRLAALFARWLHEPGTGPRPTWSEAVFPPEPRAKRTGGVGGHNAHNVVARRRRLEQCAAAVSLQAAGLSRGEVARQLGVAADTVKLLLRDGKFFADPASNPERARLAEFAAAARSRGLTRAQFETEAGTRGIAGAQAWRDADILRDRPDAGAEMPTE